MTKNEYIEYCKTIIGAYVDQPFDELFTTYAARHMDTKKWFALIFDHDGKDIVNLKCEPMEAEFLRSVYKNVTPAYHMNKTHWNTIYFDSDVPDDELKRMTMVSYNLTMKKSKRKA